MEILEALPMQAIFHYVEDEDGKAYGLMCFWTCYGKDEEERTSHVMWLKSNASGFDWKALTGEELENVDSLMADNLVRYVKERRKESETAAAAEEYAKTFLDELKGKS